MSMKAYIADIHVTDKKTTVKIFDGKKYYEGTAKYHTGDVPNVELATKIARAKAWRKYYNGVRKLKNMYYKVISAYLDGLVDDIVSCKKREDSLTAYIKKLCGTDKS